MRATIVALAGAAALGCARDASRSEGWGDGSGAGAAPSPFRAVAARIHPLTRTTPRSPDGSGETDGPASNEPVRIEAHVELTDQWGLGVRDLGVFRFALMGGGSGVDAEAGAAREWVVDLTSPEENVRRYDAVTRTYVVPLLDAPAWAAEGRGSLTVVVETTSGERLSDSWRLGR